MEVTQVSRQVIRAIILSRSDKEENWMDGDPVLMEDEIVIVKDLGRFKIGDGVRRFSELPLFPRDGRSIEVTTQGDMVGVRREGDPDWQWIIAMGPKGDPGETIIPTIGENDNWFIKGEDTGHPSRGKKGEATKLTISDDGYAVLDGVRTGTLMRAHPAELTAYVDGVKHLWSVGVINDDLVIHIKEAKNG